MVYKIFIDTNVFLDTWLERIPGGKDAEMIMQIAALKMAELYTSANNLVNTIYALKKQKLTSAEIISIIEEILTYTQLVHTSNEAFNLALKSGYNDLEDAVQYYTALHAGNIDYFITSNLKDYKKAQPGLPVLSPQQFIDLYTISEAKR